MSGNGTSPHAGLNAGVISVQFDFATDDSFLAMAGKILFAQAPLAVAAARAQKMSALNFARALSWLAVVGSRDGPKSKVPSAGELGRAGTGKALVDLAAGTVLIQFPFPVQNSHIDFGNRLQGASAAIAKKLQQRNQFPSTVPMYKSAADFAQLLCRFAGASIAGGPGPRFTFLPRSGWPHASSGEVGQTNSVHLSRSPED